MPVITISRQYGSEGSLLAESVARTLGWPLLDNELVDAVAARLGTTVAEVEAREERVPSLAQRLADAMALSSPEILPAVTDAPLPPSDERLLEMTRRVIAEAVARGPVVLVGRGAQAMLAERGDALHVFSCAPRSHLISVIKLRFGLDAAEAERRVDEMNKRREQYVRKHWNRSWTNPNNYHLCVNTAWLGVEGAAELVVRLARERFGI